jgi:hypothetical protein
MIEIGWNGSRLREICSVKCTTSMQPLMNAAATHGRAPPPGRLRRL